jgi:tRNA threonylcarbamoyladenosine biosynthesis protein TsaB
VVGPQELVELSQRLPPGTIAVGDGAVKFRQALEGAGVLVAPDDSPLHRVSAREHCRIGAAASPDPAGVVLPEYLRVPDAELTQPR